MVAVKSVFLGNIKGPLITHQWISFDVGGRVRYMSTVSALASEDSGGLDNCVLKK